MQKTTQRIESINEIFVGKKPLMTYVTSAFVQFANEPKVTIKARGMSIIKAVDVSQVIIKRMDTLGYRLGDIRLGSEELQSDDGRMRHISTIEIEVLRKE